MFRHVLSSRLLLALLGSSSLVAQQGSPTLQTRAPQAQSVPSSGITLSTGTQLVVVDVVVQDRDGHPVHHLNASDFQLQESHRPQVIKSFDEHAAQSASNPTAFALPRLPAGTFTDYTPVPSDSTLNVLLIDSLNTPTKDQSYVHNQLQQYVKRATPGARIAIFGLTSRLILLQGFTSDPEALKAAVDHRLIPRASALLDDPSGSNTDPNLLSDAIIAGAGAAGAIASAVASVKQFEAQTATFQTELRTRYTLQAFNQLARYLSSFPGRKNIVWFSGSFPLSIFPDSSLNDPFAAATDASAQLRETDNLLNRARVAVYPTDARGLQTVPIFDASRSGSGMSDPRRLAKEISDFSSTNAQEHSTMSRIAEDTGGHAFYNTNGLADAVSKSIEAGSSYYTLTYSPSDRDGKGEYRKIDVKLSGEPATRGLQLSYRKGYNTRDSRKPAGSSALLAAAQPVTQPATQPATSNAGTQGYALASMQRGAPTPSDILFKVSVLPASAATENEVAPHNRLNPAAAARGPYQRYDVNFVSLTTGLGLALQSDGRRHGAVEFLAYVYDTEGRLINLEGDTLSMNLAPETYQGLLKSGMGFHLQVSAPAKSESFLRLAIHDLGSGRMGVVEIPTVSVAHLPPPAAMPNAALPAHTAPQ